MEFRIVARKEWSGVSPKPYVEPAPRPATDVFFINTHSAPCQNDTFCAGAIRSFHQGYLRRFSSDIKFNFLVGGDGNVYEGRGWEYAPMLPLMYAKLSPQSILIGFVGNYLEQEIPEVMCDAAKKLVTYAIQINQVTADYTPHSLILSKQYFNY